MTNHLTGGRLRVLVVNNSCARTPTVRMDSSQAVRVIGLTGGTYTHSDGVNCLQLSAMTGGQAKRWYPGDLAQSVLWIALGCLSSQDFQMQSPPGADL